MFQRILNHALIRRDPSQKPQDDTLGAVPFPLSCVILSEVLEVEGSLR